MKRAILLITESSVRISICTVSRGTLRRRAVELAVLNGRSPHDVWKSDWEQAKRELVAGPDTDS